MTGNGVKPGRGEFAKWGKDETHKGEWELQRMVNEYIIMKMGENLEYLNSGDS